MLSLVGGFGLSYLLSSLLFDNTARMATSLFVFLIPCSFISFFVSEMLLNKRFHVFSGKRWVEWAVCIAICLLGTGLIRSDAFHIERKIPETDQIAAIYMYADYEHLYRDEADFETLKKFTGTFWITNRNICLIPTSKTIQNIIFRKHKMQNLQHRHPLTAPDPILLLLFHTVTAIIYLPFRLLII